jgi:arsenate reductase
MAKPGVLFLCTGNSARSQMAEALLRWRCRDRFEAHSAGTDPKGVHPLTVRVMAELGIDVSGQRSKHVKELLGKVPVAHLIVVCHDAERNCPSTWPGVLTREFWPLEDPAAAQGSEEQRLAKFRQVRDELDERIVQWLAKARG